MKILDKQKVGDGSRRRSPSTFMRLWRPAANKSTLAANWFFSIFNTRHSQAKCVLWVYVQTAFSCKEPCPPHPTPCTAFFFAQALDSFWMCRSTFFRAACERAAAAHTSSRCVRRQSHSWDVRWQPRSKSTLGSNVQRKLTFSREYGSEAGQHTATFSLKPTVWIAW